MSNQSDLQTVVRGVTGTTGSYESDWLALFNAAGTAAGAFNERMLAWINTKLGASHASLPAAQHAFAVAQGAANWSSMNTFTP